MHFYYNIEREFKDYQLIHSAKNPLKILTVGHHQVIVLSSTLPTCTNTDAYMPSHN